MTDPTPETLAELRRLLDEAPPLPYRDRPATHGDPSNGPTYVALEAQWEGRWEEVATGNYEEWCGMGIALAAAAVNALPALLDELRTILDPLPALLDAAEMLATVRDQITRGALCPMCSTGMARWTVGLVCQLCGTDYSRPDATPETGGES